MLENGLLLIQIIVMGWVIFRTIQAELRAKRQINNTVDEEK